VKLSVIIVNYNVKHFLEQCLFSVTQALKGIQSEIFVVDNNSVDGSCQMLNDKFKDVILIENDENKGFSYANNQAIRLASGEYILILNPDTVVEERSFSKCIEFMESHPETGGLGVKMIDGKGNFLPESKRALPTPLVAFFKIFGLSKLFPGSKLFGKYHLGYLDPGEIHEIDVLPGAFMFLKKAALDKIGLLDEDFFMYGEDIDLSCRLLLAGFKNYYFPETTIIHYKGESTKKGSLNYVVQFYRAMITYASKHFSRRNQKIFNGIIYLAIYFRAGISMAKRVFLKLFLPVLDALVIYLGFLVIKPLWEMYRFPGGGEYPGTFIQVIVPCYIAIWIFFILLSGGYEKKLRLSNVLKGILLGTGIILIIYALLPVNLRFSRAMILFGATWGIVSSLLLRLILGTISPDLLSLRGKRGKRIIIVGSIPEANRVKSIIEKTNFKSKIFNIIYPENAGNKSFLPEFQGKLLEIIRINRIEEIVFCSADIPVKDIIRNMVALTSSEIDYKIAPPETLSIIGSNSIETTGELYLIPLNSISKPINRRKKRLFDLTSSLIVLLFLPLSLLFVKKKVGFLRNLFHVLLGRKTWIGFTTTPLFSKNDLPELRKGVIDPVLGKGIRNPDDETIRDVNLIYAKDYNILSDIQIFLKSFKFLGQE